MMFGYRGLGNRHSHKEARRTALRKKYKEVCFAKSIRRHYKNSKDIKFTSINFKSVNLVLKDMPFRIEITENYIRANISNRKTVTIQIKNKDDIFKHLDGKGLKLIEEIKQRQVLEGI